MWIRKRLDIEWLDILYGFAACLKPAKHTSATRQAAQAWSADQDFLIALSVRSAFDLCLRALKLPQGSAVLLSALTVPDMAEIVRAHGLIPVPVDIGAGGEVDIDSLKRAIAACNPRMLVVAHLFGGVAALDDVIAMARQHPLIVVEDCAQSFRATGEHGHPDSDIALYSFGPIKTATALGGAVARVSSPDILAAMTEILGGDTRQSRLDYAGRLLRFGLLKFLTARWAAVCVRFGIEAIGFDFDRIANSAAKGFDASKLLAQIRQQASIPLLLMLHRRWRHYDFKRIDRRISMGKDLNLRLGRDHAASHSYWVYPIFVKDAKSVCGRLRNAGFDASASNRMAVIPSDNAMLRPESALRLWRNVVFLPWYPELPDAALQRMADCLTTSDFI
jgi:dTDP-4-amino-4,6-dideoxygalactose transaminase